MEKKIPSKVVHEDDQCLAFEDINPQAPVHILIIPKRHIEGISHLAAPDAGMINHLFLTANRIAKEKGIVDSGYRTVINSGAGAGQSVFHLHIHLLGGRPMRWPPG